tara:strand:- start:85 stop:885 length:801 start_codon:yes stop_codon:yes gene_type:complete
MRNFAICLLLLNLLYLSWNLGFFPGSDSEDESIIRNPRQDAPQALVLLSELDELQVLERETVPAVAITPEDISESATAGITATQIEGLPSSSGNGVSAELEPAIIDETLNTCLAFGVFENLADSNAMVAELRQQGFQARVQLQEQTDSVYRVYMPPFSSDTAARQTLANLLENGVDSFLITEGDLAQGISLGVFSQQSTAFRLQEELAAEGYATNTQEIIRSNTEFWVVVQSATNTAIEALWMALLNDQPDLKQSENLCEIIAPEV